MINYQRRNMEMEGIQQHTHGEHRDPVGHHEMSSAGIENWNPNTAFLYFRWDYPIPKGEGLL